MAATATRTRDSEILMPWIFDHDPHVPLKEHQGNLYGFDFNKTFPGAVMVTKFQADRVEFRIVVAKTRPEETVAVSFLEELDKKTVKDLLRKFEGGWGIRSPNELKSVFKTILSDVTKKERDEVLSKLKKAEELAPNDPDEAFSTLRRLPDKYKLYDVSVSFTREGEIKDFDVNCCSTPFVLNLRGKPKGVESLAKLWDAMVEIRKEAEGEGMRGHVQNRIAK